MSPTYELLIHFQRRLHVHIRHRLPLFHNLELIVLVGNHDLMPVARGLQGVTCCLFVQVWGKLPFPH